MEEKNKKGQQLQLDLSKTVAELSIGNVNFREQYLEEYHQCILCGSELMYTHNTDFIYLSVEEQAYCPHCKIQTKKIDHKLQ